MDGCVVPPLPPVLHGHEIELTRCFLVFYWALEIAFIFDLVSLMCKPALDSGSDSGSDGGSGVDESNSSDSGGGRSRSKK